MPTTVVCWNIARRTSRGVSSRRWTPTWRCCRRRSCRRPTWRPRSTPARRRTGTRTAGTPAGTRAASTDCRTAGRWSCGCPTAWRSSGSGKSARSARQREDEIAVSGIGTIAAARVIPRDAPPFIVVSMYARWIKPHPSTRSKWRAGFPDGSAHRIISDLSAFIGSTDPGTHRILAAGDLNTIYGATDDNPLALPSRDRTITDRMDALGMEFLGPRHPAGRRASPAPAGLPARHPERAHAACYTTRGPPRQPRISSTTHSPPVASTRASDGAREQPSTPPRSGARATTAACSSKSPARSRTDR